MRLPPPPELTRVAKWEIILYLRVTLARLEKRCAKLEAENNDLKEQLRESKSASQDYPS